MIQPGFSLIKTIIFVFVLILISFGIYIFFPFLYLAIFGPQQQIKGNSMLPAFNNNQYIQTQEITTLNRGDIIVFSQKINNIPQEITERIIGLPGETIKISNGSVFINDQLLSEPYLSAGITTTAFGSFISENQSILIPKDYYFVMGDNRPHSTDSREWGFIQTKDILRKI